MTGLKQGELIKEKGSRTESKALPWGHYVYGHYELELVALESKPLEERRKHFGGV